MSVALPLAFGEIAQMEELPVEARRAEVRSLLFPRSAQMPNGRWASGHPAWPRSPVVATPRPHRGDRGSIPLGVTKFCQPAPVV